MWPRCSRPTRIDHRSRVGGASSDPSATSVARGQPHLGARMRFAHHSRDRRVFLQARIVVADPLELAGKAARLVIRLCGELRDQLVRELRHIGELRPRPLERRSELLQEVTHSFLAARDAVRHEGAHLRPAQARGVPDRVVDLLDGRDVVVHEPQRPRHSASSRRSATKPSISFRTRRGFMPSDA